MDGFTAAISTIAAVFFLFVALVVGWSVSNQAWVRECTQLGTHLHDGKIYECKERK